MSGAISAVVDFGSSLIGDIGSIVTDFGTEFASSLGGLDFGVSLDSISNFGGFEQIGSFAGNADWFNAFNPGDIVSSVSSVADTGFLSSLSLPSFSDIKGFAGAVQSDFSGFIQGAQQISGAIQQAAPLVNVASSAFGIQNPIAQIAQPLNLITGIGGAAAGIAGTVSRLGNALPTLTPSSVASAAGGFGNFRELSVAETLDLERRNISPILINRLTDPGIVSETLTSSVTDIINSPTDVASTAASQFLSFYEPESGTWSVYDTITNTTVQAGLSEQQAILAEQDLNISAAGVTLNSSTTADLGDQGEIVITATRLPNEAEVTTEQNAVTTGLTNNARNEQTVRNLRNTKAQSSDWRVRLSLAPNSNYLYNSGNPGILQALKDTNGVIFPYTPSIETAYKANYDTYDLTHSNYRGYFYKNSYVDAVNMRATFTAQDTNEANYLLAVIHFFRSVTKMFYGQNTDQRGAPPPLVYIKGFGDFQFNNHPCLVSQFNYTLPPDVDYIRAQSRLSNNTNLQLARLRSTIANNPLAYSANRILNSGLLPGALDFRPPITNNLGVGNPTYVPTKMEISISLLPIQSRQQVSKNFSLENFASGQGLKGGFW
jgi:hypothetical protein